MAKVIGALFSLLAQGDLGGLLTYQKRPSSQAVYFHAQPGSLVKSHALPNAFQSLLRSYYREAVERWHDLTEAERQKWRDFVKYGVRG